MADTPARYTGTITVQYTLCPLDEAPDYMQDECEECCAHCADDATHLLIAQPGPGLTLADKVGAWYLAALADNDLSWQPLCALHAGEAAGST